MFIKSRPLKAGECVFIGWDDAEAQACQVAEYSLFRHASRRLLRRHPISIATLGKKYQRQTTTMPTGQLFDEISDAPMSTSHAIARFFIPLLMDFSGWALFTDGDVLFRDDVGALFDLADPLYAVMVVKHPPLEEEGIKKAGHIQQAYRRKNWSSVMLFNCGHLANRALTLNVLNTWTGRELHAFGWLRDDQIGELPARWNHLVGVNPPDANPAIVHYTLATPDIDGHEHDPFADEWFRAARVAGYQNPVGFHTEIQGLGLGG
jgi:hypothetical protein